MGNVFKDVSDEIKTKAADDILKDEISGNKNQRDITKT